MAVLEIDGKEYEIDNMNDEQKTLINEIQFVNQAVQRAQYDVAVYQERSQVLANNLKLSLQKSEESAKDVKIKAEAETDAA